jgi:hypothetical protein
MPNINKIKPIYALPKSNGVIKSESISKKQIIFWIIGIILLLIFIGILTTSFIKKTKIEEKKGILGGLLEESISKIKLNILEISPKLQKESDYSKAITLHKSINTNF